MYLARFSYSVLPVNRHHAINFIERELEAAKQKGFAARLLVPLTRGPGGAALQFEVELSSLDQFEEFRERGIDSDEETGKWMNAFSEILVSPPEVGSFVSRGRALWPERQVSGSGRTSGSGASQPMDA